MGGNAAELTVNANNQATIDALSNEPVDDGAPTRPAPVTGRRRY